MTDDDWMRDPREYDEEVSELPSDLLYGLLAFGGVVLGVVVVLPLIIWWLL